MSWSRRAFAALCRGGLVVAALGVCAVPASAAPVMDYAALRAAFADPSSVEGVATLTAAISQGAAAGLVLQPGGSLTLDLNGNELTTAGIALGAGSALTVTDTSAGSAGRLTANSTTAAGIGTTGATLVVEGRALVDARTTRNVAAAIGGSVRTADGGTIVIRGEATVTADGGQFSAGIGGGDAAAGGTITIGGNASVTAIAEDGAGIGGGDYSDGGLIHITDNAVVTASSQAGAGIGGGYYGGSGGTTTIDGNAVVTATSTGRGAGIGGAQANIEDPSNPVGGHGGTLTVGGAATVTATGAANAAGIGGGLYGSGGAVTINGGTVTAINGTNTTTSAVGQGAQGTSFGSLAINAPGTLVIPAPAVLRVPAAVTVTGNGYLRGGTTPGTVTNNGAIQLPTENVDWETLQLLPNNFLITFDANGGDIPTGARAATAAVRVFATSFAAGARTLPAEPTRPLYTLLGWNTAPDGTGTPVDIGPDTPLSSDLTLYAQWAADTVTTLTPQAPAGPGQDVPVAVTVSAADPSAGTPQGTVQLFVDGTPVGPAVPVDDQGMAILTFPGAPIGSYTLHVEFIPANQSWNPSRSTDTPLTIGPPAPTPGPEPGITEAATALPITGATGIMAAALTAAMMIVAGLALLIAARRRRHAHPSTRTPATRPHS